jgi:hypothetical protein
MKELLLHSLVVAPIVRWIASPQRRWSRKTGVKIAFLLLVVIALLQLRRMDLNCYELIGVDRAASSGVISRAFRKRSAEFHPDRSGAATDLPFGFDSRSDVFIQLQKCQETISSANKLSHYNRFGQLDFAYKNESMILPVMAVFAIIGYMINFVVCTIFTASPESQSSRFWIYSYLLFAMASEMYLKFLGQSDLFSFIPYFSTWMIFEQVETLKSLIPSILSSGLLLAQITHVDDTEMTHEIIQAVSDTNRDIVSYVVNKRNAAETGALMPAVIRLMRGPVRIPQATAPVDKTTAPGQQSGISIQKVANWLFYAYVVKIVVSSLRSSFGI